jgi:hypothetical protein
MIYLQLAWRSWISASQNFKHLESRILNVFFARDRLADNFVWLVPIYSERSIVQPIRLAGAGLFWEKSTAGWLLVTDLLWEKNWLVTDKPSEQAKVVWWLIYSKRKILSDLWLISQTNSARTCIQQYNRPNVSSKVSGCWGPGLCSLDRSGGHNHNPDQLSWYHSSSKNQQTHVILVPQDSLSGTKRQVTALLFLQDIVLIAFQSRAVHEQTLAHDILHVNQYVCLDTKHNRKWKATKQKKNGGAVVYFNALSLMADAFCNTFHQSRGALCEQRESQLAVIEHPWSSLQYTPDKWTSCSLFTSLAKKRLLQNIATPPQYYRNFAFTSTRSPPWVSRLEHIKCWSVLLLSNQ